MAEVARQSGGIMIRLYSRDSALQFFKRCKSHSQVVLFRSIHCLLCCVGVRREKDDLYKADIIDTQVALRFATSAKDLKLRLEGMR